MLIWNSINLQARSPHLGDVAGAAVGGGAVDGVMAVETVFNSVTSASMDFWISVPSLCVFSKSPRAASIPDTVKSLLR